MDFKNKNKMEEQKAKTLTGYAVQALIILGVVALGLLVVNQVLDYRYKSVFLQSPCSVCIDLNKNQSQCIENCFKWELKLYPGLNGDWVDSTGQCYTLNGKKINCTKMPKLP